MVRRFQYNAELEGLAQRALEARRGKEARKAAPKALYSAMKVLRPLLRDVGLTQRELERRWAEIVGEKLADLTRPEKLSGSGANRTLSIIVHPAAAPLVQHQGKLILERLRLAGCDAVKLSLQQGAPVRRNEAAPAPAPPLAAEEAQRLAEAVADIPNDRLRSALLRLGCAVHAPRQGRAA